MNSTIVPLDVNLEHLINGVLTKKAQNNDRDYGHFHPSEFDQCHRKLVYKFYEAEGVCQASEPNAALIDPRLQRIFDNGHHLHKRLGHNLEASGLLKGKWRCRKCETLQGENEKLGILRPEHCQECGRTNPSFQYVEVGFYNEETMLGGHVDAILDLRGQEINGELISQDADEADSHLIVDFKSMRSEAFRRLVVPKDGHITQMQIYLFLSGVRFGKFLYENKNDQMFREFFVARDDAFIERQKAAAKLLKKIVQSTNSEGQRTLPSRASKKDNAKECVECSFRSHCWGLKK